jgi:hypothetical protein
MVNVTGDYALPVVTKDAGGNYFNVIFAPIFV